MSFTILHLSDLHGSTEYLPQLAESKHQPDVVILTGDITHFGEAEQAAEVMDAVRKKFPNILALHGNCDKTGVEDFLISQNISLHRNYVVFNHVTFLGAGGSLPCPGTTPSEYSENMYHQWLDEIFERAGKPEKFILVTHQPPYQTTTDKAMKLVHTGSRAIREFIERTQPVLCLCGHIHESAGTDRIGNTLIINPGPFKKGQYAFISINDQQIDIELK